MSKTVKHADASTAAVVAELEATLASQDGREGDEAKGKPALAPGLVQFRKVTRFPVGRILNGDVKEDDLPTYEQNLDPATGKPRKGVRFKTARGNVRVDF